MKYKKAESIGFKVYKYGCKVSEYAQRNPNECIAEVFTGLNFGKKYNSDIMGLYKELGAKS